MTYALINNLLADIPLIFRDAQGQITTDIPGDMSVTVSDPAGSVIAILSPDSRLVTLAAGALTGGATVTVGSASILSLGASLDVTIAMPAPGPAASMEFDMSAVVTRPNPTPPTA